jgi:hypothetical protein
MTQLSRLARRLQRIVVRAYPPAWRRRYAAEVLAVLEQSSDLGWPAVANLLRAAVTEWVRFALRPFGRLLRVAVASVLVAVTTYVAYVALIGPCAVAITMAISGEHVNLWLYLEWLGSLRSGHLSRFLLGPTVFLFYAVVIVSPLAAMCHLSGLGRAWPRVARAACASAAVMGAVYFVSDLGIALAVGAGVWTLAGLLFSSRSRRQHDVPATPTVQSGSREDASDSSSARLMILREPRLS